MKGVSYTLISFNNIHRLFILQLCFARTFIQLAIYSGTVYINFFVTLSTSVICRFLLGEDGVLVSICFALTKQSVALRSASKNAKSGEQSILTQASHQSCDSFCLSRIKMDYNMVYGHYQFSSQEIASKGRHYVCI